MIVITNTAIAKQQARSGQSPSGTRWGGHLSLMGQASWIYWEGQVTVTGRKGPEQISGRGFVELSGYARPVKPRGAEPE